MLFALSADRSNSQSDFCGKGPLFLEWVTYEYIGQYGIMGSMVSKDVQNVYLEMILKLKS